MIANPPNWHICTYCGERFDSSGRYTSPANRQRDWEWWNGYHLKGYCVA